MERAHQLNGLETEKDISRFVKRWDRYLKEWLGQVSEERTMQKDTLRTTSSGKNIVSIQPKEKERDMKVRLIDYTGACSPDPWYAAKLLIYTKNTRLEQGEETQAKINAMGEEEMLKELDYISKTIRSSWEMVDFVFEIKGVTRAFTHQLVRTRTASYAQQAQRVVDMSGFENTMPETVRKSDEASVIWEDCMANIDMTYRMLKEEGIPAQDCRGVLPTNVHTNIIVKMNLRTLADMVGKRENLRAQGEYADVAREWVRLVSEIHPWTKPFLHPERTRTPALDAILAKELGTSGPLDKPQLNEALKELDALKGTWG